MVNEVISRHGVPEKRLSDQGSNFISELARSLYETLELKSSSVLRITPNPRPRRTLQWYAYRCLSTSLKMIGIYIYPVYFSPTELPIMKLLEILHSSVYTAFILFYPLIWHSSTKWKSNEVAAYRRRLFLSLRDTRRLVERQRLKGAMSEGWMVKCRLLSKKEIQYGSINISGLGEVKRKQKKRLPRCVSIPTHPNRVVTINVNRLKHFRGKWSRPYPSEVSAEIQSERGIDDDGPLTEDDLPSTSYVERLVIGSEETAFSGVSCPVIDIIARRKKNGEEQFLVVVIKAFEDQHREEQGLPELRRSARLAEANTVVDEDELLF
ncbi:LOW QUALITY PROTEIN: hypothetical protein PHMEG_00023158 [Phytophthora megakarya]|uniref:Integrase catalytic domain-containing protein n=1 Tax=Phytophthora megakarya TaxID=4795 RepID=A0A225VHI7_9STRA|nr:LOW QUALITY PROTEIN: hypothetical protein PHMEG_00023158 [Phytophthora megakarya]